MLTRWRTRDGASPTVRRIKLPAWVLAPAILFLLAAALPARAQTESVIHNFAGSTADGSGPGARLISDSSGNLYGTTTGGGSSDGGSNVANNCPDGCGTVYELVNSNGTYKEVVLYNFTGYDGAAPSGALLRDSAGDLFGMTKNGGDSGYGTVFELVNSSGTYTKQTLYTFTGGTDGGLPTGALIRDSAGDLFGTTSIGGDYSFGTVFELVNPPLSGAYTEKVLYSFTGGNDGSSPLAGLVKDGSGNLYGTTSGGGEAADGVVFKLSPPTGAPGTWVETVLHGFTGYSSAVANPSEVVDGANPTGALTLDSSGNIYGTTARGGNSTNTGIVFELLPNSVGTYTEKVLYVFSGSDGANPSSALTRGSAGELYGTTQNGGDSGFGTAFELADLNGTFTLWTLHSFSGKTDGKFPAAGLLIGSSGSLYGATEGGGSAGFGTVYEFPSCASHKTVTTVTSSPNPADAGSSVVLMASVADVCSYPAIGKVEFFDGDTSLGTATLNSSGSGSVTIEDADSLGIGTFPLTATYTSTFPGYLDLLPSTGSVSQTVNESGAATTGGNTFTGNQIVNGSVTATSFVGDGFGLTNLNPANISKGTAGIDISGNATSATTATDALKLGGELPSFYATTGANIFTGNQSVTGSVTAQSFLGNGYELTDLNPASLSTGTAGINITGNAATATSATTAAAAGTATQATNALEFGNQLPSFYATTGANNFTGNQHVAGNIAASGSLTGASTSTGSLTIGSGGTPITSHLSVVFQDVAFNTKMHPTTCTVWTGTMPSAADGDTVIATLSDSLMSSNIVFSAWAVNGEVNVRLCNPTGQPTNVGAGSIRIDLWKH